MAHQIQQVTTVTGENLDFCAIIYLDENTHAHIITRAKFANGQGVIASKQAQGLAEARATIAGMSRCIADVYGYDVTHRTHRRWLQREQTLALLEEVRREYEDRRRAQRFESHIAGADGLPLISFN